MKRWIYGIAGVAVLVVAGLLIARALGARKSSISLASGLTSRTKTFEIDGWTEAEVEAKLEGPTR